MGHRGSFQCGASGAPCEALHSAVRALQIFVVRRHDGNLRCIGRAAPDGVVPVRGLTTVVYFRENRKRSRRLLSCRIPCGVCSVAEKPEI